MGFFLLLSAVLIFSSSCFCASSESALIDFLLDGYDNRIRPLENSTDTIVVTVQATMRKLHDVDEARGEITTVMWLKLTWFDDFMSWDPIGENATGPIRLPATAVWQPDIAVINCLRDCSIRPHDQVLVESDGLVSMLASVTVTSSCHFHYGWFPVDRQSCDLIMGSISYDRSQLDLAHDELFRLEEFSWDSKWAVQGVSIERRVEETADDRRNRTQTFPKIVLTVRFRRMASRMIGLFTPCCVFSVLILLQFALTPESQERITLGVTTTFMIALYGLLLTGMESAPWQEASLFGAYFLAILIAAAVALAANVWVVNLHMKRYSFIRLKENGQKAFLQRLPKLVCIEPLAESKWRRKSMFKTTVRPTAQTRRRQEGEEELLDLTKHRAESAAKAPIVSLGDMDGSGDEVRPIADDFKVAYAWTELIKTVREILFRIDRQQADERSEEWKFAANVVNRLAFVFLCVYMILLHLVMCVLIVR